MKKKIQLFRPGIFTAMSGKAITFTEERLKDAASVYGPQVYAAPLVAGHPQVEDPYSKRDLNESHIGYEADDSIWKGLSAHRGIWQQLRGEGRFLQIDHSDIRRSYFLNYSGQITPSFHGPVKSPSWRSMPRNGHATAPELRPPPI